LLVAASGEVVDVARGRRRAALVADGTFEHGMRVIALPR